MPGDELLDLRAGYVLVVDDSRADLMVIGEALKPLGLQLRECTDAYGALSCLYEQEFAVALIDLRMPGLDGFDLAEEIRRHPRAGGLPILFVTASEPSRDEIRRAYALNAVDVISKPVMPEVLRAKVSVFVELERRRRAVELRKELEELVLATAETAGEPVRMVNYLLRELHDTLARGEGRDVEGTLGSLRVQAQRAGRFVEGLLQLGRLRLDPEALEDLDLGVVIDAVRQELREALADAGAEVSVEELAPVRAHALQLRRAFFELFDNALRFRGERPLRIRVFGLRLPGEVLVSVEDNGIGVPEEASHRIFELFRPLHGGPRFQLGVDTGMGLGLALVRRIIHLNGGRIWCEPGPDGVGTRMSFTLPEASGS